MKEKKAGGRPPTLEASQPAQFRIVFDKLGGNEPAVIDYPPDPEGAYGQGKTLSSRPTAGLRFVMFA